MNIVARFYTVSPERFALDGGVNFPEKPCRATTGSAGYDFFAPFDIELEPGETLTVPTGMRVKIDEGWFLMLVPKSGLGFKYRVRLENTVGIVDSDYFNADNEGHILVKITVEGGKALHVKQGKAFAQGIFVPFGITEDDEVDGKRTGGFGSTQK